MEENDTILQSALLLPFLFFSIAIPFGFLLGGLVHGVVGIPRWIVEHAGA